MKTTATDGKKANASALYCTATAHSARRIGAFAGVFVPMASCGLYERPE